MTQIIDRLNQTLESRTQAALAGLDDLDQQVTQAIDRATKQAEAEINARLEGILGAVELSLSTLTARVTEMAAEALETAIQGIGERLDAISPAKITEPASPVPEAIPEPEPEPEYGTQEWLDYQNRRLDEQAARDRERPCLPAPEEEITMPADAQNWSIINEPEEDEEVEKEDDQEADPEVESATHEPANRVEQYLEPSANGRHPRKKTRKGGK